MKLIKINFTEKEVFICDFCKVMLNAPIDIFCDSEQEKQVCMRCAMQMAKEIIF